MQLAPVNALNVRLRPLKRNKPAHSQPSMDAAQMLAKLVTLLSERRLPLDTPLAVQRQAMDLAVAKTPLATDVTIAPLMLADRPCERFTPVGQNLTADTILYFHGGGYVLGSLASIRPMASHLASITKRTVITLDYSLAPEHAFPAARQDALAAYQALLASPVAPDNIVLAGDSAGGGLVLATLQALRDAHVPLPAAGVCLSPWTDLTLSAASLAHNAAKDPQITRDGLTLMAAHYLAGGDPTNPGASPLFGSFHGLPPLLLHVGDAEGLLDDSVSAANKAHAAGVAVSLEVWPDMIHVWHAFAPRFPPAVEALTKIGVWLDLLAAEPR